MLDSTSLLDQIESPSDLRRLDTEHLPQLADELRAELIRVVSHTGGHLGAGLGVVELTIALHHTFDTPNDRIIWDVGHQSYPHKILTGRRHLIQTLRQEGGLSGFTKRSESEYDPFGAAHSSTSISAGVGMAEAVRLSKLERTPVSPGVEGEGNARSSIPSTSKKIVSIIGDGAMSAGMAYEAMNNAGHLGTNLTVILNDNDMSIAPPTGAMSAYMARLVSGKTYMSIREAGKQLNRKLPKFWQDKVRKTEEYGRTFWVGGTLFEELGFFYVGPIDGHNLGHLLPVLQNVRDSGHGPVLVHVVTQKGKGYEPAEASTDKLHAVAKFDIETGTQSKGTPNAPSYTRVFADSLIEEAERDEDIVAITAAMPSGTGLDLFSQKFPDRFFDVGIAEQHAVTFAGGLAVENRKPFVAIYSTFLQRAYDQVVHDISIQNLPVRFAIDRAGFVGADGATHAGSFDVAYLGCLPNFVVMAASDELELKNMVATAAAYNDGPISFRYPRGEGVGIELPPRGSVLGIGKGRVMKEGDRVALLSFGSRLHACLDAATELEESGISVTVADARFAKPLDKKLIRTLSENHELLITIEEGSVGGFGSHVLRHLTESGLLGGDSGLVVRTLTMPDIYIDQMSPDSMLRLAGLDKDSIVRTVQKTLKS